MKTIEEIENYIEEQDQNGALLVTGKWGSGKTYLIRQIEKKLNLKYLYALMTSYLPHFSLRTKKQIYRNSKKC